MGTINAIKLTITSHLFNQSIGILGNRIKKIPPTLIYNLNDRTVEELIKKVEALNNRPAKNWYNKPTQRRRQDSTPDVRPCWYHMKFGSRAHRCQPPCSFQAENL
jgi:hypothetical protein